MRRRDGLRSWLTPPSFKVWMARRWLGNDATMLGDENPLSPSEDPNEPRPDHGKDRPET